jgi:hypothetical protein
MSVFIICTITFSLRMTMSRICHCSTNCRLCFAFRARYANSCWNSFPFEKDAIECVVGGLLVASRSIADLSFRRGSSDQAALYEFVRFMQTTKPLAYSLRSLDLIIVFRHKRIYANYYCSVDCQGIARFNDRIIIWSLRQWDVDTFFPTLETMPPIFCSNLCGLAD